MKTLFVRLNVAQAIGENQIPVLPFEHWREAIVQNCQQGKARVVAHFGMVRSEKMRPERTVRVFSILGMDSAQSLLIGAADFSSDRFSYPSLTKEFPEFDRFERELFEEFGLKPEGHPNLKPVRKIGDFPFHAVQGEGVHEVAVGPVHAGIIEPGHFRFSCHGERVLHLEISLGYQHRGVENLMPALSPERQARLAESVAGDTAVGHGLAYCHAIEGLSEKPVCPKRSQGLRVIALELERLANHVGDLGALAGDIGFLPSAAWFGRLRGEFLNLLLDLTGNRYGRLFVRPGGVARDLSSEGMRDFQKRIVQAQKERKELSDLFFSATSVLSRLENTGVVKPETARLLGLVGPSARASNGLRDVRRDYPTGAYRIHKIEPVRLSTGDVCARARVRSMESKRSLQFILEQMEGLAPDKIAQPPSPLKPNGLIVSLIEGWRGEIAHVVLRGDCPLQNRGSLVSQLDGAGGLDAGRTDF